jgi:hypothetical protein
MVEYAEQNTTVKVGSNQECFYTVVLLQKTVLFITTAAGTPNPATDSVQST